MKPKILIVDIETAPATAYVWRIFDENIGLEQLITPGHILCWGAKWFGKSATFFADKRGGVNEMLVALADLLNEADAVVTYNGDRFDLPKITGAMAEAGLPALPPITSIDVCKTVKRLGLISNKLAFVGPFLKVGKKVDTNGFKLWRDIMDEGPEAAKAWEKMERYNIQDVKLLDSVYRNLRPFIKNHPFLGPYGKGRAICGACGSKRVQRRGNRMTMAFAIERLACQDCGSWTDGTRRKINNGG